MSSLLLQLLLMSFQIPKRNANPCFYGAQLKNYCKIMRAQYGVVLFPISINQIYLSIFQQNLFHELASLHTSLGRNPSLSIS